MFWIVTPVLILVAALFVIVPLWRHHRHVNDGQTGDEQRYRDAANLAIFEERLAELQGEYDDGAFDGEQFESLKAELERSLLSDVRPEAIEQALGGGDGKQAAAGDGPDATRSKSGWRQPARLIPVLVMLLVVPPVSYLFYEWFGFRSDMEFAALVQRAQQLGADREASADEIRDVISDLDEAIEQDPENGWAWYFMARQLTDIGQIEEARTAFQRAAQHVENEQDRAAILGQYAQIEYLASEREITDTVQDIISRARRINPNERSVLQLLGSDAFLNEDYRGAITYWQRLLSLGVSRADRQFLQQALADARQRLEAQGGSVEETPEGPVIRIRLSLARGVTLAQGTRIFVSAQDADLPGGPPLAARALTVAELPATVTLSSADAVGPRDLASAGTVHVVATASLEGTAEVQSGDWQGRVENVKLPQAGPDDGEDGEQQGQESDTNSVEVELQISTQVN